MAFILGGHCPIVKQQLQQNSWNEEDCRVQKHLLPIFADNFETFVSTFYDFQNKEFTTFYISVVFIYSDVYCIVVGRLKNPTIWQNAKANWKKFSTFPGFFNMFTTYILNKDAYGSFLVYE